MHFVFLSVFVDSLQIKEALICDISNKRFEIFKSHLSTSYSLLTDYSDPHHTVK